MYKLKSVEKSLLANKKYRITLTDGTTEKHIWIGDRAYEDFTQHKDENRKELYLIRHKKNEKWGITGITTAGFWSRWLLWNKPTLRESIKDVKQKFGI
jgi:hypothetical protein